MTVAQSQLTPNPSMADERQTFIALCSKTDASKFLLVGCEVVTVVLESDGD
jgi:hypothetical protein